MKINDFPEKTTTSGDDFLLLWDSESQTTKKIKVSTLSGNFAPPVKTETFTYSSNGDTNGLFYWLGLVNGTFNNPQTLGKLLLTTSSTGSPNGVNVLTDRMANEFYTNPVANSWVQIRIIDGQLRLKTYSIRSRFRSDGDFQYRLQNWKFQGSNDASSWTDIDVQTNNLSITGNGTWVSITLPDFSQPYSYFRLLQNGETSNNNGQLYLCLGELELYGEYTY